MWPDSCLNASLIRSRSREMPRAWRDLHLGETNFKSNKILSDIRCKKKHQQINWLTGWIEKQKCPNTGISWLITFPNGAALLLGTHKAVGAVPVWQNSTVCTADYFLKRFRCLVMYSIINHKHPPADKNKVMGFFFFLWLCTCQQIKLTAGSAGVVAAWFRMGFKSPSQNIIRRTRQWWYKSSSLFIAAVCEI